jgi:uncharacterized membrane protein YdjX (TVP38/TMEM64 family)
MKTHKTLILVSLVGLLMLWALREPVTAAWAWFSNRGAVVASMHQLGFWGPAVLFTLLVWQVFLAFIPGQALMIACGYLYGFWGGMLITWTSLVGGGQAAFLMARRYGRPFAERWVSPGTLVRWDKAAQGQGVGFFALSLVLPIFPNDAMCYIAGLGKISSRRFLAANMIGRSLACLLANLAGAYGPRIPVWGWGLGVGVILTGCMGWVIARRRANGFSVDLKGGRHVSA